MLEKEDVDDGMIESMAPNMHAKSAKGHELPVSQIPVEQQELWQAAMAKEWTSWVRFGAVVKYSEKLEESDNIMNFRWLLVDKNAHLGVPEVKPKARLICLGFRDKDALEGKLSADAPTLPEETFVLICNEAMSQGWTLHQGDVESAFLTGVTLERKVLLRAPETGFPAVWSEDNKTMLMDAANP